MKPARDGSRSMVAVSTFQLKSQFWLMPLDSFFDQRKKMVKFCNDVCKSLNRVDDQ